MAYRIRASPTLGVDLKRDSGPTGPTCFVCCAGRASCRISCSCAVIGHICADINIGKRLACAVPAIASSADEMTSLLEQAQAAVKSREYERALELYSQVGRLTCSRVLEARTRPSRPHRQLDELN